MGSVTSMRAMAREVTTAGRGEGRGPPWPSPQVPTSSARASTPDDGEPAGPYELRSDLPARSVREPATFLVHEPGDRPAARHGERVHAEDVHEEVALEPQQRGVAVDGRLERRPGVVGELVWHRVEEQVDARGLPRGDGHGAHVVGSHRPAAEHEGEVLAVQEVADVAR